MSPKANGIPLVAGLLSESLEKGQKLVWGTIPAGPTSERICFGESFFFQFNVGVEIHLRSIHGLIPEPHRDYPT